MTGLSDRRVLRELRDWVSPLLLLCAVLLLTVGLSISRAPPGAGQPALAVFPPWWSEARSLGAVLSSGARAVAMGPADWLVVAVAGTPEGAQALRERGALLLLAPVATPWCAP